MSSSPVFRVLTLRPSPAGAAAGTAAAALPVLTLPATVIACLVAALCARPHRASRAALKSFATVLVVVFAAAMVSTLLRLG